MGLLYGQEVIAKGATKDTAIGGFLQAIADHGDGQIGVVPILRARANLRRPGASGRCTRGSRGSSSTA